MTGKNNTIPNHPLPTWCTDFADFMVRTLNSPDIIMIMYCDAMYMYVCVYKKIKNKIRYALFIFYIFVHHTHICTCTGTGGFVGELQGVFISIFLVSEGFFWKLSKSVCFWNGGLFGEKISVIWCLFVRYSDLLSFHRRHERSRMEVE